LKEYQTKYYISTGKTDESLDVFYTLRCVYWDDCHVNSGGVWTTVKKLYHSHVKNLSTNFDKALINAQQYIDENYTDTSNLILDFSKPECAENEWGIGSNAEKAQHENKQNISAINLFDMFDKWQNLEWVESIPASEERQNLSGVVLGTKLEETQWGDTLKMLFKDERGFKLWGSVPSKLKDLDTLQGAKVSFNALVSRSKDDAHFGFFKRPTKAFWVKEAV